MDVLTLGGSDAIMDTGVTVLVEQFISSRLTDKGYAASDSTNVPVDLLYSIELEAVSVLINNYQGYAKLCERLADQCQALEEIHDLLSPHNSANTPQLTADSPSTSRHLSLTNPPLSTTSEPFTKAPSSPSDYILDGLCLILAQNFQPDPFKMMLAERDSTWTPPPFYWALLKEPRVVETFRRLYDRNRGSEFLGAFFQDYCERIGGLNSRSHLSEITAHFSIFTKAFSELLVEFLVDHDTYEFGDQDPHNISRLLCHAENAYCYAQALLHFLPYCQPQFASCRRLAQLIFRNLREAKSEFDAADRLLLCTALPNYPDLFKLFRSLKDTDRNGRMIISGSTIGNICDSLGKVIRRFEKHKTLLLFHEGRSLPPTIGEAAELGSSEEGSAAGFVPPLASWESEMLRDHQVVVPEEVPNPVPPPPPPSLPADDDRESLKTADIIQPVDWPVAAEIKNKSALPVFWNLPSASQAGDDELIEEEAEDESDRRGSTKLVLPPMDAIRETLLLDQLWEFLVCPNLPSHPANLPVHKLIELILMLTTFTNYELAVLHLQRNSAENARRSGDATDEEEFVQDEEVYGQTSRDSGLLETEAVHYAPPWTLDNENTTVEEADDDLSISGLPPPRTGHPPPPTDHLTNGHQHPPLPVPMQQQDSPMLTHSLSQPSILSEALREEGVSLGFESSSASHFGFESMIKQQRKRPRLAAYASSIVSSYVAKSQVPSTLESCIYKDPHEGSRLRAFRSPDPTQQEKLLTIFTSCQDKIEEYQRIARKELFELYHITQMARGDSICLSDHLMLQLSLRCQTSAGASAVLRFVEEALLPEAVYSKRRTNKNDQSPLPVSLTVRVDPLQKMTPALLTLLLRLCIWHPRKRILVIALFKRVLEESFSGPMLATDETQFLRRRLLHVAMGQLGLCERPFEFSAEEADRLPWRAIESDWAAAVVPGYKLVFHMIRELLPCFDLTLLRESLEFVLVVCGTPYAAPFAERLCDLLRAVALLNVFDFAMDVNSGLRNLLIEFISNVYATWAPDSPPEKVLQQCQVIAEAIGMSPEQMPIMPHIEDDYDEDIFSDEDSSAGRTSSSSSYSSTNESSPSEQP